jgi:hypothetical protein
MMRPYRLTEFLNNSNDIVLRSEWLTARVVAKVPV